MMMMAMMTMTIITIIIIIMIIIMINCICTASTKVLASVFKIRISEQMGFDFEMSFKDEQHTFRFSRF